MSELALELIREAKEKQLTYLDLGRCGLTELPNELFKLSWLEELNLSTEWAEKNAKTHKWENKKSENNNQKNRINHIPINFYRLKNLRKLIISGNFIEDIRPLEKLINLNYLNLANNNISDISPLENLSKIVLLIPQK